MHIGGVLTLILVAESRRVYSLIDVYFYIHYNLVWSTENHQYSPKSAVSILTNIPPAVKLPSR
jgi:hypothetical protein